MSNKKCNNLSSAVSCERADELMYDYIDGTLTETEKAAFEAHIAECAHCTEELEQRRLFLKALSDGGRLEPKRDILNAVLNDPEIVKLAEKRRTKSVGKDVEKLLPVRRLNRISRYLVPVAAAVVLVSGLTMAIPFLRDKNDMLAIDAEMLYNAKGNAEDEAYAMYDSEGKTDSRDCIDPIEKVGETNATASNDAFPDIEKEDTKSNVAEKVNEACNSAVTDTEYELPKPVTSAPAANDISTNFDSAETGVPSTGMILSPILSATGSGFKSTSIDEITEVAKESNESDAEYEHYRENTVEYMITSEELDDEEYAPLKSFEFEDYTVYVYEYSIELEEILINNAEMQNAHFITARCSETGRYMIVYVKN